MEIFSNGFFSGLSGLQLNIPKYLYPPPFEKASRLTYYASLFNSIEINSSFYKIPQSATLDRWFSSVPQHFKFTFKLWKEITHSKGLNFKEDDVKRFLKSLISIQDKRGCLLIQFPPSLGKEHIIQLEKLLKCIKENISVQWKIAVEFRNNSWYDPSTDKLLNYFKAALVLHDIPKSATPMATLDSDFMYIRFHGPTGNYRDSYAEDYLTEYATYVHDWLKEGKEVYLYLNNTMGDAFNNLRTINELIKKQ